MSDLGESPGAVSTRICSAYVAVVGVVDDRFAGVTRTAAVAWGHGSGIAARILHGVASRLECHRFTADILDTPADHETCLEHIRLGFAAIRSGDGIRRYYGVPIADNRVVRLCSLNIASAKRRHIDVEYSRRCPLHRREIAPGKSRTLFRHKRERAMAHGMTARSKILI